MVVDGSIISTERYHPKRRSFSIAFKNLFWTGLSVLQNIFRTALYLYARDGQVAGFADDLLAGAMLLKS